MSTEQKINSKIKRFVEFRGKMIKERLGGAQFFQQLDNFSLSHRFHENKETFLIILRIDLMK